MMNRTIFFLALIAGFMSMSTIGVAETPKESFLNATKLYGQESYPEALGKFKKIIDEGYSNPAVEYNIGNCYARMGEMGHALVWYRRAQKQSPRDSEILANIHFILRERIDKLEPRKTFAMLRALKRLDEMTSMNEQWIFLSVLYCLFFILMSVLILVDGMEYPGLYRAGITFIVLLGLLTGLTGFHIFSSSQNEKKRPMAVVVLPKVDVMTGPVMNSRISFTLHDAAEVDILKTDGSWNLVRIPSGLAGWVKNTAIEKI